MQLLITTNGTAHYRNRVYAAAIGRKGITNDKTEGDGASPAGTYELCKALYREDRVLPPTTALNLFKIKNTDGWCDAPNDPNYNKLVTLPYHAHHEILHRSDPAYDILVTTNHNTDPVVPGAGSAIFLHIIKDSEYQSTEGCVAFSESNLREILSLWNPYKDRLVIQFTGEGQK